MVPYQDADFHNVIAQYPNETERSTLSRPRFREKIEYAQFSLGGVTKVTSFSNLKKGYTPFGWNGHHPVRLYSEGNEIYADFSVWGGKELPAIEIRRYEFVVRPSDWDRNWSSHAFEVVDANQFPRFQMFYKSESHIVIHGIFPTPMGVFIAYEDGLRPISLPNDMQPNTSPLKRIFKYPYWKYLGELDQ